MLSRWRSASPSRERLHIAILSFNRPAYLREMLTSLRQQISEDDEIVLMQDGGANAWSGRIKASSQDVKDCIALFNRMIPWGTVLESSSNISIALNYERAERYLFETQRRPHAIILEDDLVLSPRYLDVMTQLIGMAQADRRIAYVSAYGNMWASQSEQHQRVRELTHMHENWGFAMTREAWLDERPFRQAYLDLIADCDYSQRDHKGIIAFYEKRGWSLSITSQDAARWMASLELGKVRVTTFACFARYIGKYGEHCTPELYDRSGFERTVMYGGDIPALTPPTSEQIDRWLQSERQRFSGNEVNPFYEGHGLMRAVGR